MKHWFQKLFGRGAKPQPTGAGFNLAKFKHRVRGIPPDDVLWEQLLALLDANVWTEAGALVTPGIGDEEAHRLRGRIGMVLDLKRDLQDIWAETHAPLPKDQ